MTRDKSPTNRQSKNSFRFSLRQAAFLIAFICFCIGVVVAPEWQKGRYHAWWGERGGVVNADATGHDSVTRLNFANSKCTTLPAEMWQLGNLNGLVLSCRNLEALPSDIGRLTKLDSLALVYMQIESLPSEIGQLSELTDLHLEFNRLTSLPAEIAALQNLKRLDLQGNSITDADVEHLKSLSNLEELWLQGTNISEEAVISLSQSLPDCKISSDY